MFLIDYVRQTWSEVRDLWADRSKCRCAEEFADLRDAINGIGLALNAFAAQLDAIEQTLSKVLADLEGPGPTASIDRIVTFRGAVVEGDTLQIKDNEQFDITLANPKDAKGQPSQIDPSKTVFQIDNPFATLTPGADGLTCNVKGAAVGSAQISGSVVDANNPDDKVLFTPLHLDVIAGDTVTIDVTTGPVTPQ